MKLSKPVSKSLIRLLIFLLGLIFIFVLFLPIYTYFGTYFIKKVCLYDKCYLLPRHWIIEVQIKNQQQSFFGVESISYTNKNIKNLLFLRSNSASASVDKYDYNLVEDIELFKNIGYIHHKKNNCSYWSRAHMIDGDRFNTILFVEDKLNVSIHGEDSEATSALIDTFCNPLVPISLNDK